MKGRRFRNNAETPQPISPTGIDFSIRAIFADVARNELQTVVADVVRTELAPLLAELRAEIHKSSESVVSELDAEFLNEPEVLSRAVFSRSTLRRQIDAGSFPEPVRLSANRVAWRSSDVQEWLETRMASKREKSRGGGRRRKSDAVDAERAQ